MGLYQDVKVKSVSLLVLLVLEGLGVNFRTMTDKVAS